MTQLLREAIGVEGLDGPSARDRVRGRVPGADPENCCCSMTCWGSPTPIRRSGDRSRRPTSTVDGSAERRVLAHQTPTLYVVEDADWIDEAGESMLAAFITVIPQTPSLVLMTYRPEYEGGVRPVTRYLNDGPRPAF